MEDTGSKLCTSRTVAHVQRRQPTTFGWLVLIRTYSIQLAKWRALSIDFSHKSGGEGTLRKIQGDRTLVSDQK